MASLNNFNPNSGNTNPPAPGTPIPMGPNPWDDVDDIDPEEYLINYNKKHQNDDPIMFRDTVVQQTLSCLIGKYKSNALLVGAAGVGKTKIVEDIARRIETQDPLIPDQLNGYTIYELPLSNIIAGSGIVGDVEKKAKSILEFAKNPKNKVVLFIDEIHMLFDNDRTYGKIAQILKPAMARNDVKIIGATTMQEAQMLMDDPAFNRRFTRLIVDELSKEQTKSILDQIKVPLFEHYGRKITITDRVIDEIILIADEYKTIGSHRPDNAITLLDRSMADAYINRKNLENKAKTDPAIQAALNATPIISLSKSQMKKTAMRLMTGNSEKTEIKITDLADSLSVIKGQDNIISCLIDYVERDDLNLFPRKKPLAFLFAGNSGVGKSEIAKIIANVITNSKAIVLNMTEYHSPASINRIIGAPAGYIGSDSKTELPFDILESNPYQVILLDEFEKADKSVQRLFMSAFDEGYIKTSRGKTVDFSKSIIIATTNAGHMTQSTIGYTNSNQSGTSVTKLSAFFNIELLNRFTKILDFNPITKDLFTKIMRDTYSRRISEIKSSRSIAAFMPDELPDDVTEKLVEDNYTKEFGARPVNRAIQKYIEDAILENNRQKSASTVCTNTDDAESIVNA